MRDGWLEETMEAQRLMGELRLDLFYDILAEARKGPGKTDTNAMIDWMDARAILWRAQRALDRKVK